MKSKKAIIQDCIIIDQLLLKSVPEYAEVYNVSIASFQGMKLTEIEY